MRHNNVTLYGKVVKQPVIQMDEDGNYIRGKCQLLVIRGLRDIGDNAIINARYDVPIILSGNQNCIAEMATWHANDMVYLKGVITTKNISKSSICPVCKQKNTIQGTISFVTPIFCEKREEGLTDNEAIQSLKEHNEISNEVLLIGALCREPQAYESSNGTPSLVQYQLAVNRKMRIKEDPSSIRTDYPWIKAYGDNAVSNMRALIKGSLVLIDGILQTREIPRDTVCSNEECGAHYKWNDVAMEVVPYSVEYMQNFRTTEDIEREEEEQQQAAIRNVFGEDADINPNAS